MGNTPVIRLNRMVEDNSAEVLVKFEGLNVGGSIKTRTAFNMIRDAEEKGLMLGGAPDTFLGAGIQTCRRIIEMGIIGQVTGCTAFMEAGAVGSNVRLGTLTSCTPAAAVFWISGAW